jgi:chromosome segregation ATPase
MTTVALPDVKALPLTEQTETAILENGDSAAERHEPAGGEVHTLHEKLENAFAPSQAELPPKIYQSGFDAAVRQQTAAFHDLSARVEKLEDRAEIEDLRNALREMCEILSGLTTEQERGAAERDANLKSLAEAMAAEHEADREKFKALIETITAERDNDRERVKALTEVAAAERAADHVQLLALQESAKAMAANHEKSMAEIRSGLTLIGDHIGTMAEQNEALTRELNTMKNEFLRETDTALDKHWNALSEMEKAVAVLKNHDGHTANRIAILESNDEDLARRIENANEAIAATADKDGKFQALLDDTNNAITGLRSRNGELVARIAAMRDEIAESTAESFRGHQAQLGAAEKSIAALQAGQQDMLAAMEGLKDEISNDVAATYRGHQRQSVELEKNVGTLQERDLQTQERLKMLRVYTENLTRDVDAVRNEMMEFNEAAAVVQAHQKVLEQAEEAMGELKERQVRTAMRAESLAGRQEDLQNEMRLFKADLTETAAVLRANQKESLEQTEKGMAELRDRQTQSASRIEALDGRQRDIQTEAQHTKTDLAETGALVQLHQSKWEESEKSFTELRDRQNQQAHLVRGLDGRQQETAEELRQARTSLREAAAALDSHRASLDQTGAAILELKDRQTLSAQQIRTVETLQEEFRGDLSTIRTDLKESVTMVMNHQATLEESGRIVAGLSDRLLLATGRIEALDGRQQDMAEDLNQSKSDISENTLLVAAHQSQLEQADKALSELKERQARASQQIKALDARQIETAGELRQTRSDLKETAGMVGQHAAKLEEAGEALGEIKERQGQAFTGIEAMDIRQQDVAGELRQALAEIKDRQARAASQIKAGETRQDEFSGELRQTKADLKQTANQVEAHSAKLEQTEQALGEFKERQAQSFAWIDSMDGRHEDLSTSLRQARSELKDWISQVDAHRALLDDNAMTLSDLKERQDRTSQEIRAGEARQAQSAQRIEALASRQDEAANELRQVKTDIKSANTIAEAHATRFTQVDEALGEIRDRQGRTAQRMDAIEGRQSELTGELRITRSDLKETAGAVNAHQGVLEGAEKAVTELKDRASRAASRLESLQSNLSELSGRVEAQANGARALDDRLSNAERVLAQAQDRERTLAQLHARAADTLRSGENS